MKRNGLGSVFSGLVFFGVAFTLAVSAQAQGVGAPVPKPAASASASDDKLTLVEMIGEANKLSDSDAKLKILDAIIAGDSTTAVGLFKKAKHDSDWTRAKDAAKKAVDEAKAAQRKERDKTWGSEVKGLDLGETFKWAAGDKDKTAWLYQRYGVGFADSSAAAADQLHELKRNVALKQGLRGRLRFDDGGSGGTSTADVKKLEARIAALESKNAALASRLDRHDDSFLLTAETLSGVTGQLEEHEAELASQRIQLDAVRRAVVINTADVNAALELAAGAKREGDPGKHAETAYEARSRHRRDLGVGRSDAVQLTYPSD